MLYNVLLVFEVLLAIGLVALILLQQGKGADAGAAFGSGASGTVFGSRGASNFLSRSTAVLATLFFLNCLALAFMISHRGDQPEDFKSVVEQSGSVITEEAAPVVTPSVDEKAVAPEVSGSAPAEIPEAPVEPSEPATTRPADIPE